MQISYKVLKISIISKFSPKFWFLSRKFCIIERQFSRSKDLGVPAPSNDVTVASVNQIKKNEKKHLRINWVLLRLKSSQLSIVRRTYNSYLLPCSVNSQHFNQLSSRPTYTSRSICQPFLQLSLCYMCAKPGSFLGEVVPAFWSVNFTCPGRFFTRLAKPRPEARFALFSLRISLLRLSSSH